MGGGGGGGGSTPKERGEDGRCTSLMGSVLDSGSNSPGSSPCWGHRVVFLCKTLSTLIVPLFTQVYKWVPSNLMLGGGYV